MTTLIAMALTAAGAMNATSAPLAPSGPWVLDDKDHCAITRQYGAEAAHTIFGITAMIGRGTDMIWVQPPTAVHAQYGDPGRVTVQPSGANEETGIFGTYSAQPIDLDRVDFEVHRPLLEHPRATAIEMRVNGATIAAVDTSDIDKAIIMLNQCESGALARWGIDPSANAAVTVPAEPADEGAASWFKTNDYPAAARRAGAQGRVVVRFLVGADGIPADCIPVESSGNADLDQKACTLLLARAHFHPATDKNGKPVASTQIFPLRWTLP